MKINIWADGPLFNYTRSVIQHSHSHTEASAHEHIYAEAKKRRVQEDMRRVHKQTV